MSVIILNYKRLDALAQCLDTAVAQDYPNYEIIVVDNHSEEDVRSLVEAKGRNIRLVELPQNLGTCGGRNAGINVARGEIIVTIDNDVNFITPHELTNIVRVFADHPEFHVLTFRICDMQGRLRLREWCHPRYWKDFSEKEFETTFLPEGASAYRREVFERAGLYFQPFFIGHEGGDLALRIMDHGLRILYAPSVRVGHLASEETRSSSRTIHLYTRNYIWLAYKDYPLLSALRFVLPKLAMMLYHAFRASHLPEYFRGIWDGLTGLADIHGDRTPISKATLRYVNGLEKTRPSLRVRLERHRAQPQI
ncbi:MAG TPA: glycosyltransferase family 2 protein [Clostridia bacterium]|nr:glycosyltransferase family 2 protein [Clostridia bacterium]